MKKICIKTIGIVLFAVMIAVVLSSAGKKRKGITVKDGVTVVDTSSIVRNVTGNAGATPVKIHIEEGKITKIEALDNQETPGFFDRAEQVLQSFIGLTPEEAATAEVDAVSGATYSSEALVKTVKGGMKYFIQNDGQ